ncbi:uncharacterized protein [Halyomorpha halys]|uniref:uncharacterized protein n=1 Tax=Halyomorpha halys TaxID=286706 RepID=UPI0006D4D4F3|nr:uncharacterized protein LOC106683989 [Halyomorpha halys]
MDPVWCLPPEAMEGVWKYLEIQDLLNCRLVSNSWNKCLCSDPVWKRYLPRSDVLPFWESFLESKRLDYNWNHGVYKAYTIDISDSQFAIGDNNIYKGQGKRVTCYSPDLIEQYSLEFDCDIVGIHPFADMVAYVLLEEKFKHKVKILKKLKPLAEYQTDVNRISAGTKKICFQNQNKVIVFDGKSEYVHDLPGDVVEVIIINDRLLVKSVSSVFMGCNITFYLHGPGGWQVIWKGRNSPMAYMFCHVQVTSNHVFYVGATQTESGYEYSDLCVQGREVSIVDSVQPSRCAYFRFYSSGNTLIYTQSENLVKMVSTENWKWEQTEVEPGVLLIRSRRNSLILVYQGRWVVSSIGMNCPRPGPWNVEGAIVKRNFLALWSKSSLHIYYFADQK